MATIFEFLVWVFIVCLAIQIAGLAGRLKKAEADIESLTLQVRKLAWTVTGPGSRNTSASE